MKKLSNNNGKKWWKSIKQMLGLSKSENLNVYQALADAEGLGSMNILIEKVADFFYQVSSHLNPIDICDPILYTTYEIPDQFIIPVSKVKSKFDKLSIGKAPGPDGVPPWILREFSDYLAEPFASIFNSAIQQGMPSAYKQQTTIPIPKKQVPKQIETDLRPIALTAIASKVLESFPCSWASEIIFDTIGSSQYGNQKGSSTTDALIDLIHFVAETTDKPGKHVRALLCDYSKAFDLVNHNIILQKLRDQGLPEFLLKWFASFLINRQQTVRMKETISTPRNMQGGAPQGTLTGPLTFISYINDLQFDSPVRVIKYVDDTTILSPVTDPHNTLPQEAADHLSQWSSLNDMRLNDSKTKEIIFSFSRKSLVFPNIKINGTSIEQVESVKLLGLTIQNDLKWNVHIDQTIKKARKRLFFLSQLKRAGISKSDLLTVYKSLINPVLNYGAEVFHAALPKYLSDDLEGIQKMALRIIASSPSSSYEELLQQFNMASLKDQRLLKCKNLFEKITTNGNKHKLYSLFPKKCERNYNLRRHRQYENINCRTKRFKNTFIPFIIDQFNYV